MSEATSTTPARARAKVAALLAERPRTVAATLYVLLLAAGFIAGYWAIFSRFTPYDDEGNLLVTLRAFAEGDPLYREIYIQYGPFYYEVFGGFFAITGKSVSTDASRLIVVAVWNTTSLLFGLTAHRLTGRLSLGLGAMAVAFSVLTSLTSEPMHPVGLCLLLISAVALVMALPGSARLGVGAACGALIAALALTKINLGALAVAAFALAAVLTVEPLRVRRWVRWPVVVAFLALPVGVMAQDLREDWVRDFIFLATLSAGALVVAASRGPVPVRDAGLTRLVVGAMLGFAAAAVAILAVILATGPSVSDVYGGVVTQALRQRDALTIPFELPGVTADWGIAALVVALIATSTRLGPSKAWPGMLRILAGVAIWLAAARAAPFGLDPGGFETTAAIPVTLAWVGALPPAGLVESPMRRFARVFLCALAVTEFLQIYPVAGTQVLASAAVFGPVGAICLADGLFVLRRFSAESGFWRPERMAAIVTIVAVALAGKLVWGIVVREGISAGTRYAEQKPLPFGGATRMRLLTDQANAYIDLVALIRGHRCTALVGLPNFNSLYLWAFLDDPKPTVSSLWFTQLDARRQQQVVDQLRSSPRPCVVRNDADAADWLASRPRPDPPLVRYILEEFESAQQVGNYRFELPKRAPRG